MKDPVRRFSRESISESTFEKVTILNRWSLVFLCAIMLCGALIRAGAAADSPKAIEDKIEALEQAYKAGILSEQEYTAKKKEMQEQLAKATPKIDLETQKKLDALEQAYKAGILSEQEYTAKKKAILEQLPNTPQQIDPATQKKLQALEEAHKAGILTKEEFDKKAAELVGGDAPKSSLPKGIKQKTYRHPIGFTFMYPADWQTQINDEMLVLTPPGQAQSPQGPTEIYFIAGESVEEDGITDAMDPQVVSYLDMNLTQLAPFLRRQDEPRRVTLSSGTGAVLDWEGQNMENKTIHARAYVAIINKSGVGLYALGHKDLLEKRYPQLEQMFSSFGFTQAQRDPQLVGTWNLSATNAITNQSPFETAWSRAQAVNDSKTNMELRADGTWTRVEESHMLAGAGGVWLESKDQNVDQGTWCAGNGQLHLIGKDDMWESYQYRVEGASLRLVSGQSGQVWQRTK